ncbi:MAG: ornithine cyclodeaminase family protein [Actinomycetota bacterium]|nr:ornithine cyclodeaminase family protein [Actinomycetota bacterium]
MSSSPPPYFDRAAIESAVSPLAARAAIAALASAGGLDGPQRWSVPFGGGELLLMPAAGARLGGVKVVALPDHRRPPPAPLPGVQGLYVLFDNDTLAPVALLDAAALTELRTAAVSAFVADCLLPAGDIVAMLFGTGAQARAHLVALDATRPLVEVLVVGRREEAVATMLAFAAAKGIAARPATAEEVDRAGVVCCCTTSAEPLFDGARLAPGTHVIAVGSHRPTRREVDTTTVRRSFVVVETRPAARREAGDLLVPLAEGAVESLPVDADLAELAAGVRADADADLTLFKSVGVAAEDLAVAEAVLAVAEAASTARGS